MITLATFNVNGIRSALEKGFLDWIKSENHTIVHIQETKAQPEQIDKKLFESLGYNVLVHSAEKKGYSGLATLSKLKPENVVYGIGIEKFDSEGRIIRFDIGELTFVNVYIPSGTQGDIRQQIKMEFLDAFQKFINNLKKNRKKIIVSGDFNICHKAIDINHPEKHTKSSGFLPEEREWFDGFIESGMIDTFRMFDKSAEKYSWWSYRAGARPKNLGWRIDYNIVSHEMQTMIKSAAIQSDVVFSDHCPVLVSLLD